MFTMVVTLAALCPLPGVLAADKKPEIAPITDLPENAKVLVPGFKMTYFVGAPQVPYPTCLTAAPTGELFVGSDPNGSISRDKHVGKIYRVIDSTGSGKADKINVFAEDVDSARGMVYHDGVLIVLHPPLMEAFYDDNHTGVANRREVLVDGIGRDLDFRGADHTINGIQMGIDGWIYVACGDYGWNNAVGKDGKKLQFRGGGIARVRPDGTEIERFTWGQRNIYDVAIDPLMNVYTRDNTNDGDAWNDRLSHVEQYAQMGYPTLFMHFQSEILDCLADYGGGAPCGSLYVDEPGFPKGYGDVLYTCEWGRSKIYRHPFTPNGATFKPTQEEFVNIERPTDMDIDGQGRMYIASWRGGQFTYAGPNIGYIARVVADGNQQPAFPDLRSLKDDDLLAQLAKPSATYRMHAQREMLRRGDKPALAAELEKLAAADGPLATRVAAIFTLKQLRGVQSTPALLKLAENEAIREWTLRAVTDRVSQIADVPLKPYIAALNDANPRVRVVALVGLARIGKSEAAPAMISLLTDKDPVVAHTAMQTLRQLHPVEACVASMEHPESPSTPAAIKVLEAYHESAVVDALIAHLPKSDGPVRKAILTALCRLYSGEAEWDGKSWWGTRPDTRGPYYKPAEWKETSKIGQTLSLALKDASPEMLPFIVLEMYRHRVETPEAMAQLGALGDKDASFRAAIIEMLAADNKQRELPVETVKMLEKAALIQGDKVEFRAKAVRALQKASGRQATDAVVRVISSITAGSPAELVHIRQEWVREGSNANHIKDFVAMAEGGAPLSAELAFEVLIAVKKNGRTSDKTREQCTAAIDAAWKKPVSVGPLLRAIGNIKAAEYRKEVEGYLNDPDAPVKAAAAYAQAAIKGGSKSNVPQKTIADVSYEQAYADAVKIKGDAKVGAEMFLRQGCVQCHTISQSDPPKGPYLGDIGTRYPRTELIESVLKPSAKIAQGFETHWFKLKGNPDRKEGFVVREGGDDVEIRDITGVSTTIQKKDIEKRGKLDTSIMPEGIAANMTIDEFASLLAYLESLRNK